MQKRLILYILYILIFIPMLVYAEQRMGVGIGGVAENMMDPVEVFSDFIHSACILIGGSFIFASIIKYIEHRRSPLMIPISTVVFLLLAGIILVLLPLISYVTSSGIPYSLLK
jgi:hypothetical protein